VRVLDFVAPLVRELCRGGEFRPALHDRVMALLDKESFKDSNGKTKD
jgi:hypothetical protein